MQNNVQYTTDTEVTYMEQEEEWEREGLLDPAWEKQQKKVGYSGMHNKTMVAWNVRLFQRIGKLTNDSVVLQYVSLMEFDKNNFIFLCKNEF